MTDFESYLIELNKNLAILEERRAKYSGNEPLDLIHQIDDHRPAIHLTEQAIANQLTEVAWREEMAPLLIAISERKGPAASVDLYFPRTTPRQCPPRPAPSISLAAKQNWPNSATISGPAGWRPCVVPAGSAKRLWPPRRFQKEPACLNSPKIRLQSSPPIVSPLPPKPHFDLIPNLCHVAKD